MEGALSLPAQELMEDVDVMEGHMNSVNHLESATIQHTTALESNFVGNVEHAKTQSSEQFYLGNPQYAGMYNTPWFTGPIDGFSHNSSLSLSSAGHRDDAVISSLSSSSNSDFPPGFQIQNGSPDWMPPASSLQDAYHRLETIWHLLPCPDDVQITALSLIAGLSRERTRAFYLTAPFLATKQIPMEEFAVDFCRSLSAPQKNPGSDSSFTRAHYSGHPDHPLRSKTIASSSLPRPRVTNQPPRKAKQIVERNLECFWPRCNTRSQIQKFKNEGELRRHMEPLHCPQFVWICPICTQQFKRRDKLIKHVKELPQTHLIVPVDKASMLNYHSPQTPPSQFREECGFCGTVFLIWNDLFNHIVNHFNKGKTMAEWRDPWTEGGGSDSGLDEEGDDEDDYNDNNWDHGTGPDGSRGNSDVNGQTKDRSAKQGDSQKDSNRHGSAEGTSYYKSAIDAGSFKALVPGDINAVSAEESTHAELHPFAASEAITQGKCACGEDSTITVDPGSDGFGTLIGGVSLLERQELLHDTAAPVHTDGGSNENDATSEGDSVIDKNHMSLSSLHPQSTFRSFSDTSTLLAAPLNNIDRSRLDQFPLSRTGLCEKLPAWSELSFQSLQSETNHLAKASSDGDISWEDYDRTVPEGRKEFLYFLCSTESGILIQESALWFTVYLEQRMRDFWSLIRHSLVEVSETDRLPTNEDITAVYRVLITLWKKLATEKQIALTAMVDHLVNDKLLADPNTRIESAALYTVVFTLLGFLTTLYEPRPIEDAKPDKLQIAKNIRKSSGRKVLLKTLVIKQKSQGFECVDQPFYSLLDVFGRLLPEPTQIERSDDPQTTDMINASHVCYHTLQKVCGIQVEWVDSLGLHLEFDAHLKVLKLYRLPSFCLLMYHGRNKQALFNQMYADRARDFLDIELSKHNSVKAYFKEMLLTYRLLFGQDQSSHKLFKREMAKFGGTPSLHLADRDPILYTLCGEPCDTPKALEIYDYIRAHDMQQSYVSDEYAFFSKRIFIVQNYVLMHETRSLNAIWYDRRSIGTWWNFWVAMFVGGFTILLSFLSLIFQIWEVVLAREQLHRSGL